MNADDLEEAKSHAEYLARCFLLPARRVRRGINTSEQLPVRESLRSVSKAWRALLTDEEDDAVTWYSISGFQCINGLLRGRAEDEYKSPRFQEIASRNTLLLDSALAKAPRSAEPRVLHRFMSSPKGASVDTACDYFDSASIGDVIADPGFMSTTADADYLVQASRRRRDHDIIAIEIVSSRGGVVGLEDEGNTCSWSIQDDEREVLLPRNSTFIVTGIVRRAHYVSTRLSDDGRPWSRERSTCRDAFFDVIQMVDITDF